MRGHLAPADEAADSKGYESYSKPVVSGDHRVFELGGRLEACRN